MPKKILIIEDDSYSANLYQRHLDNAGYQTEIASDGKSALSLSDSFLPDLILLDLILPKIDGFTLLHFFKKVPVIVISNLDQETDVQKCIELGAKIFITKDSLNYNQLIVKINELLHH